MTAPLPSTPSRETGTWTPQKFDKAWRIFNGALPVMAAGVGVPADELRAFLIEGIKPTVIIEPAEPTLQDRIVTCHEQNPDWSGRVVADHLGVSYGTLRGLASRAGIKWPAPVRDSSRLDSALIGAPVGTKFMLQSSSGAFLHMECKIYTKEKQYAWVGTASQLQATRRTYAAAKSLRAVAVNDPRFVPSARQ